MERTDLVERAASIRRILEQNADEADRLRRLPDANVNALKETGLCRLMVPARFGGHQTDIRTYIAVMAELGRACGATAWVASLINVCAWLASLLPEQAQQEIWASDPDAWIAGSLAPHGEATPVDGGWRVNGRWMWASGCLHAQWAACGIHMKDEQGRMTNLGLSLMPMLELSIEDTWFMSGMKGTGSNTIVARDGRGASSSINSARLAPAIAAPTDCETSPWESPEQRCSDPDRPRELVRRQAQRREGALKYVQRDSCQRR